MTQMTQKETLPKSSSSRQTEITENFRNALISFNYSPYPMKKKLLIGHWILATCASTALLVLAPREPLQLS